MMNMANMMPNKLVDVLDCYDHISGITTKRYVMYALGSLCCIPCCVEFCCDFQPIALRSFVSKVQAMQNHVDNTRVCEYKKVDPSIEFKNFCTLGRILLDEKNNELLYRAAKTHSAVLRCFDAVIELDNSGLFNENNLQKIYQKPCTTYDLVFGHLKNFDIKLTQEVLDYLFEQTSINNIMKHFIFIFKLGTYNQDISNSFFLFNRNVDNQNDEKVTYALNPPEKMQKFSNALEIFAYLDDINPLLFHDISYDVKLNILNNIFSNLDYFSEQNIKALQEIFDRIQPIHYLEYLSVLLPNVNYATAIIDHIKHYAIKRKFLKKEKNSNQSGSNDDNLSYPGQSNVTDSNNELQIYSTDQLVEIIVCIKNQQNTKIETKGEKACNEKQSEVEHGLILLSSPQVSSISLSSTPAPTSSMTISWLSFLSNSRRNSSDNSNRDNTSAAYNSTPTKNSGSPGTSTVSTLTLSS